MSNSPINTALPAEEEISLIDILRFLKGAYKTSLVFGILGFVTAIAYLVITPKQYEATAQIMVAQIGVANNNNISPLGINIEDPALLIVRLAMPTTFTAQEIAACGFEGRPEAGAALAEAIKVIPHKGISNIVELKTVGQSPQLAIQCAAAIIELIKTTQNQLVISYIEEAKLKLVDDEKRLANTKDLAAKQDKEGSAIGVIYLSTRDEIRFLLDQITAIKRIVSFSQNRATRMVAPIYVNDTPIAPKKRKILAAGLFGGLFLGLLIALARQMIAKFKS